MVIIMDGNSGPPTKLKRLRQSLIFFSTKGNNGQESSNSAPTVTGLTADAPDVQGPAAGTN